MSTRLATLLLALALAPALARADEPSPAAPAPGTTGTAKPGATPTGPAATPPADAVPESSKDALARIRGEARKAGSKMREVVRDLSGTYLADAEERGATFAGEERVYFGILQAMSGKGPAALETLREARKDASVPEDARNEARGAFVEITSGVVQGKEVSGDAVGATLAEAETALGEIRDEKLKERRGVLHFQLATAYQSVERQDDALRHYADAPIDNPALAPRAARAVVEHWMERSHGLADFEKARSSARPLLARFDAAVDAALATAREKGDKDGVKRFEGAKKGLVSAAVPLELVGNPVPAWTAVHAFRGGASPQDYRGKVVLVDFWATWCHWCVKSFPAMRDLLEEYGDKGFAIVGVTTSAPRVFDARYDLDDDVKAKAPAEWKAKPTLDLARDASEEDRAAHRTKEREVLATFLANHEVPWDVVMVEGEEPAAKYGLSGWPYGILLDRQGRVRRMHAGAILREDPKGMAEMRALIESLLAEPADGAAAPKKP
jgi:thiol-disulfide isomerase/thioredoxin